MFPILKSRFTKSSHILFISILIFSCTPKSSVKIEKMDDLTKQNRCPLKTRFGPSSGVGDVILQAMTEDSSNLIMKKYIMKAFNISDKKIIGFNASLHYYDKDNLLVHDTSATPKLSYLEFAAIQPGDSVELEATISKPRNTKTKLDIREVLYKEETKFGEITMRWRDKNYPEEEKTPKKK